MRDTEGADLPDLDAVREEARRRAFLFHGESYRKGEDRQRLMMDVTDETRSIVLSLMVQEAIQD